MFKALGLQHVYKQKGKTHIHKIFKINHHQVLVGGAEATRAESTGAGGSSVEIGTESTGAELVGAGGLSAGMRTGLALTPSTF